MILVHPTRCSNEVPFHMELLNINEHPWHMHEAMEVVYVLKGSLDFQVSIYPSTLNEGDIAVINTETLHYMKATEDNVTLICHINLKSFSSMLPETDDSLIICNSGAAVEYDKHYDLLKDSLATVMTYYYGLRKPQHDEYMDSCVSFLSVLYNHFNFLQHDGTRIHSENIMKQRPLQAERVRRVMKYIYDHLGEKISLEYLAEKEYVNKYYLSHLVSEFLSMSFRDYLNMTRSVYAQDYLYGSDMSLASIAEKCGFSNAELFRKAYQKYTGHTPSEDRKRISGHTIKDLPLNDKDALLDISLREAAALMNVRVHHITPPDNLQDTSQPVTKIPVDFSDLQTAEGKVTWDTARLGSPRQMLFPSTLEALKILRFHHCFRNIAVDLDDLEALHSSFGGWDFAGVFLQALKEYDFTLIVEGDNKDALASLTAYGEAIGGPEIRMVSKKAEADSGTVPAGAASIAKAHMEGRLIYPTLYKEEGRLPYLFDSNNLKTDTFYTYYFLNQIQGDWVYQEDGYCFACTDEKAALLIYNNDIQSSDAVMKKYMLHLKNLTRRSLCRIMTLDSGYDSEADLYEKFASGRSLDDTLKQTLYNKAQPELELASIEALPEYSLFLSSEPDSLIFVELI